MSEHVKQFTFDVEASGQFKFSLEGSGLTPEIAFINARSKLLDNITRDGLTLEVTSVGAQTGEKKVFYVTMKDDT